MDIKTPFLRVKFKLSMKELLAMKKAEKEEVEAVEDSEVDSELASEVAEAEAVIDMEEIEITTEVVTEDQE